MRGLARYALACAALVAVTAGIAGALLPPDAGPGLWVAGGAAWGIQVVAAGARIRYGSRPERLLAVWGWSTGGRLLAIGLAGWAVYRFEELHPVSTLVGLAGYLFAMLLMEPMLLRLGSTYQTGTR